MQHRLEGRMILAIPYKQIFLPRKGAFSHVPDSDLKKFFLDKLPDSQVSLDEVDTNRVSHHFHICLTRLTNHKIFTFKIKVLSSIFVQN